ncbi:DUF7269 family protein [Halogranum rubrum]|uniref:Uncharacterized protein n=1 Tax=Halogranum salarium B-1 TaxID=1210908 RepID=J3EUP6_9EURY|nr:hypothetical protein [Halogranum salarium]EJN58147.1 hypothetical protein HSB1_35640 [Halogranum salarium B-1]
MNGRVGWKALVFGALGVFVTLSAAAFAVAPEAAVGSPLGSVADTVADADTEQLLLVVAAVVGLVGLWTARNHNRTDPDDAFDTLTESPPEVVSVDGEVVAGHQLDEQFATVAAGNASGHDARVLSTLRSTAVDVLSLRSDVDDATRAVACGRWTDDTVAAAMLAGPDGPRPSLWSRVRLWLDPVAERERRLRRTVEAIETALDDRSESTGGRP